MATLATVRGIVRRAGGSLVSDGCGGYEAVAPNGRRWAGAEVTHYPLPLNETETVAERNELLETAARLLSEGVEDGQSK